MCSRGYFPDGSSDESTRIRGSLRGARLGALALVLTIGASPASAQHDAAALARIDSLADAWRAAAARANGVDSASRASLRVDTLEYFGFLIVTDSADAPGLRDAASRALERVARDLGPTDAKLLEGGVAFMRFDRAQRSWSHLVGSGARFIDAPPPDWQGERRFETRIAFAATQWLLTRGGTVLRAATGGRLPTSGQRVNERAFIELVTTPSVVARLCYGGHLPSCAQAMGIVPTDTPLTTWYDANDRVTLARRLLGHVRRNYQELFENCVNRRIDQSCIEFLPTVLGNPPRPPFTPWVTRSLVSAALRMGGDGAYTRLVADTSASLVPRLEAAAGADLDSLLTGWRTAVLATRPVPDEAIDRTTWSTLFWVVVAGVLAMRSSRWR